MSSTVSLRAMRWLAHQSNSNIKHHRRPTVLFFS